MIGLFPLYNIRLVSWPFLKNTLISRKKKIMDFGAGKVNIFHKTPKDFAKNLIIRQL